MWFKNIQFKLVNLSKCGRRQRKREKKKGGYTICVCLGRRRRRKRKAMSERKRDLLSAYWLCFGGVVYFVPNVLSPPSV